MYLQFFGLSEAPFAITPDPAFVYLSPEHRDALAHLLHGVGQGGSGGFVQLTGEVGTGKTTMCRCLLEQLPDQTHVALVLNPLLTPRELLATICEELGIDTRGITDSSKAMVDALNAYLLAQHAKGHRVVVVIDEAQNLSPEALEQVRLLTNLETPKEKLLQMVLLGQPELRPLLRRQNLRQLAQRITARYHLEPLNQQETAAYVRHRMKVAGAQRNPFTRSAMRALYQRSCGVPRLINIIADRALAGAYARESGRINARLVHAAADEVQPSESRVRSNPWPGLLATAAGLVLVVITLLTWGPAWLDRLDSTPSPDVAAKVAPSRAALTSASVPVKVMVPSPAPVPTVKVRPEVPERSSVPLVAVRVTCTGLAPASTSLTESAVPADTENTSVPSRGMVCVPGTVFTGASFTAVTVMFSTSTSVRAPPRPVLARSSVPIWRLAEPLKLAVGVKTSPSSAALMSAMAPVKTAFASAVPSPVVKVRPVVWLRLTVPLVTVSATCTGFDPASGSVT